MIYYLNILLFYVKELLELILEIRKLLKVCGYNKVIINSYLIRF